LLRSALRTNTYKAQIILLGVNNLWQPRQTAISGKLWANAI
jgi:hypothetical protein